MDNLESMSDLIEISQDYCVKNWYMPFPSEQAKIKIRQPIYQEILKELYFQLNNFIFYCIVLSSRDWGKPSQQWLHGSYSAVVDVSPLDKSLEFYLLSQRRPWKNDTLKN